MNNWELLAVRAMRRAMTIVEERPPVKDSEEFNTCMGIVDRLIWLHDNGRSEFHVIEKNGAAVIDDDQAEMLFKLAQP